MRQMNIELNVAQGKCVLVDGPASINVKEGKAVIFAAPAKRGDKIVLEEGKRFPLDCLTDCEITLNLSNKNQFKILGFSSIPASWRSIAFDLLDRNPKRIMVIGESDAGKSSLCTYLSNIFIKKISKIHILDLDLGQSDLGPPATIGLGMIENFVKSITEANILNLYFVGSITPDKAMPRIFKGVNRLSCIVTSNYPMIVNTDGWISDVPAVSYKLELMNLIRPSVVVGLGEAADKILRISKSLSYRAHSPFSVLRRKRVDRRGFRERRFYEYLKNGKIRTLDLNHVVFRGQSESGTHSNSLVGLSNSEEWLQAIGVLKELDFKSSFIKIHTNFEGEIHYVDEGCIKVNEVGLEILKS